MASRAANLKIGAQRRIVVYGTEIQTRLVAATPILTGKARAEWQVGLDHEPTGELLSRERPPTQVDYESYSQAAQAIIDSFQSGQTIYIVNNAPYIASLNAGFSAQASANFVQVAIDEAGAVLRATL